MPTGAPAQQFLAIETIKENIIVLKDGGLRVILMCSSLNFALKSTDEQDAIIYQYQNFLNSLDFPLELVIHSRRLNIAPYLESLRERQKGEMSELLKIQINEYTEFVRTFTDLSNIMSKTFYAVVPYTPPIASETGIFKLISSLFGTSAASPEKGETVFAQYKNQIWQRAETVIAGLQRTGIRAVPLNTEELIELFYGLYNPTEFEGGEAPAVGAQNKTRITG